MRFSKNVIFNCFLAGILGGMLCTNITEDFLLSCLLLGLTILVGGLVNFYYRCFLGVFLSFYLGFIGAAYYGDIQLQHIQIKKEIVHNYTGLYLEMQGEVSKLYKRSDFYDEYIIDLKQISDQDIENKIFHLLRVPKNFTLTPEQYIEYQGKIYPLLDFDGFAYEKYMQVSGIYFSTSANSFETLQHAPEDWKYLMYRARQDLLAKIAWIFPNEEAIFLGGILFGARENIPQDLKEDFNNSGLTHFIAVSGFNITLCVIFVTFLFGFLPAFLRAIVVTGTIIGFSIFVGLGAPVVRAAIMGILGYVFLQTGNSAKNITILLFAAVCMSLYSPLALNYDVSLHLSFLAVIGIMYTQSFFQKIFARVPETFAIREALVLTMAALSFSLPIMMFQFGQVSILAPFSNVAVTWTIPLAMIAGAITLIVDSLSPTLGVFFGFIAWILLHYDIMMVRFFGNLEWALFRVDFGVYAMYLQVLYFIILTYIVAYFQRK